MSEELEQQVTEAALADTITKKAQQTQCVVCFNDFPVSEKTICGCAVCFTCQVQQAQTECQKMSFQAATHRIACANIDVCGQTFSSAQIVSHIATLSGGKNKDKGQLASLESALNATYAIQTLDVRRCPEAGCGYFGFVDTSRRCGESLHCEACGKEWKDRSLMALRHRAFAFLDALSDARSRAYKHLFSNSCPSCGIAIQRVSGCPRMTCTKCKQAFCWNCVKLFTHHNQAKCFFSTIARRFLHTTPVLYLLKRLGFFRYTNQYFRAPVAQDPTKGLFWNLIQKFIARPTMAIIRVIFYHGWIPIAIGWAHLFSKQGINSFLPRAHRRNSRTTEQENIIQQRARKNLLYSRLAFTFATALYAYTLKQIVKKPEMLACLVYESLAAYTLFVI